MIVDYLQLMQAQTTTRDANRVQEVSEISRGLKALARELSVPVIALSQLSRQPEMRESKEPRLSDLRESGAIEQDADLVCFLWREKERGQDDQDQDGEIINLKLAKHRNGPTGEIQLWFKKKQTRFVSYAGERYARRADQPTGSCGAGDASPRLALVLEPDLDLDPVLDDLAVAHLGRRLHDLDRLDVADGLRRGLDRPAGRVAPRVRAAPDHLANDDDAHGLGLLVRRVACLAAHAGPARVRRSLAPRIDEAGPVGRPPCEVTVVQFDRADGQTGTGASGAATPARTLSKHELQYTGRSFRGANGTIAWPPQLPQIAAWNSRGPPTVRARLATARQEGHRWGH